MTYKVSANARARLERHFGMRPGTPLLTLANADLPTRRKAVVEAGRKKKVPDPEPSTHLKNAVQEYAGVLSYFEKLDLPSIVSSLKEKLAAIANAKDKKEILRLAGEMDAHYGDAKGGVLNNEFFSQILKIDAGGKEVARAARRVAKGG